jgi:hypothetical protein
VRCFQFGADGFLRQRKTTIALKYHPDAGTMDAVTIT